MERSDHHDHMTLFKIHDIVIVQIEPTRLVGLVKTANGNIHQLNPITEKRSIQPLVEFWDIVEDYQRGEERNRSWRSC